MGKSKKTKSQTALALDASKQSRKGSASERSPLVPRVSQKVVQATSLLSTDIFIVREQLILLFENLFKGRWSVHCFGMYSIHRFCRIPWFWTSRQSWSCFPRSPSNLTIFPEFSA